MYDTHIIHKVCVEVKTSSEKQAIRIKNEISAFLQQELFPLLEKLFEGYATQDSIVRFDKLEVNISTKNPKAQWSDSKEQILKETIQKLRATLESETKKNRTKKIEFKEAKESYNHHESRSISEVTLSSTQNTFDVILFFVQNGYLPWYGRELEFKKVVRYNNSSDIVEPTKFFEKLKTLLLDSSISLNRFINQFSDEFVLFFIETLVSNSIPQKKTLIDFLRSCDIQLRYQLLKCLLLIVILDRKRELLLPELLKLGHIYSTNTNIDNNSITNHNIHLVEAIKPYFAKNIIKRFCVHKDELTDTKTILENNTEVEHTNQIEEASIISSNNNTQNEPNKTNNKETPFFTTNLNDIIVKNAGIIILHPFLSTIFDSFDWLDEAKQLKMEFKAHAVQLLHYCATGEDQFPESELILEKFICDTSLNTPIPCQSLLKKKHINEVENMLNHVIKNWPALKNTSPDGLRQMFFQRNGKLGQKKKKYVLMVERKVQDALLDKLQWNISLIKLQWKKDLLFVEW